jgi:oligopeptidase B
VITRIAFSLVSLSLVVTSAAAQVPAPPVAKVVPKVDTIHGDILTDNYFWLRDRKNPDVVKYLEAENAYTAAMTKHLEPLQEQLYQEMLSRIKQTDLSVPVRRDSFYYYTRTEEGKQYTIYARKKGTLEAPEEILLDENAMAAGKTYFSLGGTKVTPDHRLFAYLVDTTGSEHFTLMVKNIAQNRLLPDKVDSVHFGLEWANDNRTIFYTRTDSAQRPDRIFRHTLGMPTSADVLVLTSPTCSSPCGVASRRRRTSAFSSSPTRASRSRPTTTSTPIAPLTGRGPSPLAGPTSSTRWSTTARTSTSGRTTAR